MKNKGIITNDIHNWYLEKAAKLLAQKETIFHNKKQK